MTQRDIYHHPLLGRLLLIAGVTGVLAASYATSFGSIWSLWQSSDHHHGILVFPIVAFLIWRKRHELATARIHSESLGLVVLTALCGAWSLSRLAGIQFIEHVAVLGMIPAAVWTLLGRELTSVLLFPLLFVLMATPVSDALVPFLMVITADISTGLLRLSGIPVLREGQYITLPGGNFVVADVCSGVRYLIAGGMLTLLYGYLTYTSWLKRALLVVVTSAILILTNGVRAYIVMAVASATNLQYMGGRDHIYFGWLLFGIVMMFIMWIGARYADEENVASAAEPLAKSANSKSQSFLPMIIGLGLMMLAATVKPLQADIGHGVVMLAAAAALLVFVWLVSRREPATAGNKHGLPVSQRTVVPKDVFISVAGLAILLGTPLFVASIEADTMQPPDKAAYEPVLGSGQAGEWKNTWRPVFNGAAFEYTGSFDYEAGPVNVYVAGYQSALQGSELISSSNQIIPPDWDRYVSYNEHQIRFSEELSPSIVEIIKTGSGSDSIVWYWYNIDSEITSSTVRAKFLQVLTMLRRRPAGGSVVVLETPLGQNAAQARQRLSRAAKELIST